MTTPALGVITGLAVEARILRRLADAGLLRVAVAGANAARATALAEGFAEQGVRALMSFGICGGLLPALRVGHLVLADSVVHPDDGERLATDAAWRDSLRQALKGRATVSEGALVGSATLVEQPADKAALQARWQAQAVDMESHAVARVAARRGLPFLVVRACSDAAERAFPIAALEAMSPDGSFRVTPVLKTLARKPWVLPPLLRLAHETNAALATLKRVASERALLPAG